MPTFKDMAIIYEAAKELVKASRETYPNADDETIKASCNTAVLLALTDDDVT